MNHTLTLKILLAVIMFTSIFRAFAMDRGPSTFPGATRSVDIDGNIFQFSMPENFSRDMPANDMIKKVDTHSQDFRYSGHAKTVIQRWWDVKERGFFGKNLGSLMMNIAIHKAQDHSSQWGAFDTQSRFDYIIMIDEHMTRHYDDINKNISQQESEFDRHSYSGFSVYGDEIKTSFNDRLSNNQLWTHYGSTGPNGLLTAYYSIPISPDAFIEVQFLHAPNHDSGSWEFLDRARNIVTAVVDSFHVDYAKKNPVKAAVEEHWQAKAIADVIGDNQDKLLTLFEQRALDGGNQESRPLESPE
ncbi:hypothetical protein [Marinimicrobium alkaliphilum]|uniref:hypothetical protein n=1 Tax=Marinimicrobium alkaliphilum TaxID=2202654 RepID=UPI0013007033|nr:hypothetical protein [Marinimicrobium alkaliphilum]